MAHLNARSTTLQVSMNQICLLEIYIFGYSPLERQNTRKSYTLVIIQNASAPRDSGQIVGLHKLTVHRAQKYCPRQTATKKTAQCSKTTHRHGLFILQHGNLVNFSSHNMCHSPLRQECPPDPFVSVRHPERHNSSSAQLWQTPLFFPRKHKAQIHWQVHKTAATAKSQQQMLYWAVFPNW